jgi:hypothetical protein
MSKRNNESIIRNLVFGIQDSFGSTVGFLSGVAVSGISRETLLFTGILLIFVEAFSMALGSLISEHVVLESRQKKSLPLFNSFAGPITMFLAYVLKRSCSSSSLHSFLGALQLDHFYISIISYISNCWIY